jgi:hypothetical protein
MSAKMTNTYYLLLEYQEYYILLGYQSYNPTKQGKCQAVEMKHLTY